MRRKKESNRPFIAGFAITVIVLFSLFIGLVYLRPPVPVTHLPSTIPSYTPLWSRYVPQDFLLFGFENYTAIRHFNSSYPTQFTTLFDIIDLNVSLKSKSIDSALTVSFSVPNVSVAFAFVNQGAWRNFTTAFEHAGFAAVVVGNDSMYFVRDATKAGIEFGWIALVPEDRGIAFAIGSLDARAAVQNCLEVTPGNGLMANLQVRQMLYVANGTANHLAIGVQGFPGAIPAASRTMTVVDVSGSQVLIRRILEFNSTTTAVADYNVVKQTYLASRIFEVFDSYVQTSEFQPLSDLVGAVRLVE